MEAKAESTRQVLRLRGRSYVAFALCPTVPIVGWLEELDRTLARSPGFFVGKPVVLDMSGVEFSQPAIAHLVASLAERNIRILGIEGVNPNQLTGAMPPLLTGGRLCALEPSEAERPEAKPPQPKSLLLDSPVRSGQSVAFADGDVTVLGSVGSGAEIVAGGSIHIYGTLRGRAMAGVNGNATARIYCQRIEAELLAIDGYYRTAEDINTDLRNRPIQAWLDGNIMRITPLN